MGMVGAFSVMENLILDSYYSPTFAGAITLKREPIAKNAVDLVEQFDIRPPMPAVAASTLSGGNQQKMIVAREFSRDVPVIVCSQPTRGVDVGSIEYIHAQIVAKRDQGAAVLVVSTELDEVIALSDRILVMFQGRVVAERVTSETSPTELGLYMAGRTN
jgi:simple sugar transport system ATP-binding protein